LRLLRDVIFRFEQTGSKLILIDYSDKIPDSARPYINRFDISLPDETELEKIIKDTLRELHQVKPIQIDITRKGLNTIIRNLRGLTRRQAREVILDAVGRERKFDNEDINRIMAKKRQVLHSDGLLDYIEAPTDLGNIGGLTNLKKWLSQRKRAITGECSQVGIDPPRGVLMLGVQGAGKSLCAKAIATAWQLPLLRMDPGRLYDSYIGESEKHLRMALKQAESMSPIVLWIDEIEKAFASAASHNTDGGLSRRMFGSLLTWMQEHDQPVFLVATANDIGSLPAELLRKGRFDEIFFVDLPDMQVRQEIFAIHLRKRKQNIEQFDLDRLAQITNGFSGAEIEQSIIAGLHEAFDQGIDLNNEILKQIIENSPPLSVTMAEQVEDLRLWATERCVPAG
ncbi:MAG: AAA family ATPase, partial [Sedimentisphaerales bacterium]|nr:AAA family ATPase [Sedimentisphaerales bacterium]